MQAVAGVVDEQFVQMWVGTITALCLLGAAAGGLVFGWLVDRVGRVRAMILSILCYSLFKGLTYLAQQPRHLGAFRFIAVIGINFAITRDSWGWVMLVGAAPELLTRLIILFVPDSDRWKEAVKNGPARLVRKIFSSGLMRTTLLAICFSSVALIVPRGIVRWIPPWVDQMTHGQ